MTGMRAALDITHATTKAHSIGSNHTFMMSALIAEYDAIARTGALVEIEGAQIHPRRTAHLLINMKLGRNALMPYGIMGIIDTALYSLIAYIDSIATFFGNIGLIGYLTKLTTIATHLRLSGCSGLKGILVVYIGLRMIGKASRIGLRPRVMTATDFAIAQRCIVIDNHFLALPVTLTRGENYGASLLEHRY